MRLLCFLTLLTLAPVWTETATAQNVGPMPTVLQGEITEIKEERKSKVLVVTDQNGETHEIRVTPKMQFEIRASGDHGFIREGAYVGADAILSNGSLYITKVSVLLPRKGLRPPRGMVVKAPAEAGQSQNAFKVLGQIKATQPNPEYPEFTMIALRVPGNYPAINLESGYEVTVVQTDPEFAEVGMKGELTGKMNRGKLLVNSLTLQRQEPFESAEIYGSDEADE
ncbi:hypothetical protein KOR42_03630 [Thalassoglobus neptunius]|uniref:DUF5666 domain-containing protein n=1 Tax=Thalassoglobus neptunius TaxID=1938619 RepID=A0A5C5X256_9PLAN|nr:hypothetical protein [Thalassoglobus neptunius]TWT57006.1 hypothetical protein KOR42_03630 [Thalassoglobus neptunius]